MDVGSLSANGAVQSQPPSCVLPPITPQLASSSMGDQHPLAADAAAAATDTDEKSTSSNMVVSRSEERSENFYNYSESTVLTNKGLKGVENSVTNDDTSLRVSPLEMEAASPAKGSNSVEGGAGSECDDEPVECGDCDREFLTLQQYMDHSCARADAKDPNFADNESEMSDGESFNGKIVYNPDGSAYIIEGSDSEISDLDLDVPTQDGAVIDKKGLSPTVPTLHPISNAFFVPRNPSSFLNNYCNTSSSSPKLTHEAPIMHSYRVYDVRTGKDTKSGEESSDSSHSNENHMPPSTSSSAKSEALTVPTKPILMCFICKLSFGFAKSFTAHASTEHSMHLNQEERTIMSQKNASAIIQGVGKNKKPLMSFLEPIPGPSQASSASQNSKSHPFLCANALSSNSKQESTTVSYVYTKPKISLPSALENKSNDSMSSKCVNSWVSNSVSSLKSEDDDDNKDSSDSNGKHSECDGLRDTSNGGEETFTNSVTSGKVKLEYEGEKVKGESSVFLGEGNASTTASTSAINSTRISSVSSPSLVNSPTFTGFLGMCDEHPQGRAQGVECPKCDMILSSSQSLGGHMTMMHSRNSCKTLKCPKCNWHYKYQETLEIHMKEKHPDNDTQCIYCITNQAHPRLARGETYSCGYKPYRCEVCNYSTTTKGNLSIHMQSDKHINNMQDLANGGTEIKMPTQQSPYNNNDDSQFKKAKPKQTWRCDVCNYETTVARNLRIHMTSEKHTHNMMVLQQNMKHMQRDMHIQMNQLMMLGQQDPALFGLPSPMSGGMFPFDQQVLMAGLPPGFEVPVNLSKENGTSGPPSASEAVDSSKMYQCCVCNIFSTDSLEALHQHLQHDRSKQRENEHIVVNNGTYLCNLCTYKTNLKANFQLHCKTDKHIQRLQLVNHIKEGGSNNEWRLKYLNVSNPIQVRCNCCDYYTNSIHKLQMHTSNLQHEGSAQLFRHLQNEEGKLDGALAKYYQCSVCTVSTRTKLRLIQHVHSMKHLQAESLAKAQAQEDGTPLEDLAQLFMVKEMTDGDNIRFDDEDGERDVSERAPTGDEATESSEKNRLEGSSSTSSLVSAPSVSATTSTPKASLPVTSSVNNASDAPHVCPYCTYSSSSESTLQAHVVAQHKHREVLCPLCQDEFKVKSKLERHLMQAHNVTAEGLQKLLLLVDAPPEWTASSSSSASQLMGKETAPSTLEIDETREINVEAMEIEHSKLIAEAIDVSSLLDKSDGDNQYRCQTCSKTFAIIDQLYAHQNELGHLELKQTPRGPGYLCWKKGCNQYFKTAQALQVHFREIHAKRVNSSSADPSQYSHQCSQCTLAFKSADKLQLHNQYHLLSAVTNCCVCCKSFHSIASHRKHIETAHSDLPKAEGEKLIETLNSSSKAWHEIQEILEPKLKQSSSYHGASLSAMAKLANSSPSLSCSPASDDGDLAMQDEAGLDDDNDMETSCSDSAPDFENSAMFRDSARYGDEKCDSDKGDSSSTYKEQQFMEDFINSQAMAEGSYEDPGRKYKCHRCKVAFTKQNYLTAHNKTLQHRRGDKMSYPIERYLDPNRPFKCDVCKESFTQKNILLVHYNSVSHLHKLKQAAQQGTLPPSVSASSPTSSTSTSTTSSTASSESEKKPYRCNICKVAYNQGSTLDIHIRSVAHQTRASKIHELAMTGQIDINQPLIEQPDMSKTSQQPVQLFAELNQASVASSLQQQSLLFPGMPTSISGITQLPVLPGMSLPSSMLTNSTTTSPQTTTTSSESTTSHKVNGEMLEKVVEKLSKSSEEKREAKVEVKKEPNEQSQESSQKSDQSSRLSEGKNTLTSSVKMSPKVTDHLENNTQNLPPYFCQRCNSPFVSQDALNTHQQIYCFLGAGANSLASQAFNRSRFLGRFKPQVHRNLLENIGFECVMQFNEYNQGKPVKKEKEPEEKEEKDEPVVEEKVEIEEKIIKKEEEEENLRSRPHLPEINKCSCVSCGKDFSSVWVLKAHQEEVHKELVPIEVIEDFGEKFKTDFDKKQPKEEALPTTPQPGPSTPGSSSSNNEKGGNQEMPPPPPPPPPVSLSSQFDMSSVMPGMFGMMPMPLPVNLMTLGMHPPLMPMMMPPSMDMSGFGPPVTVVDPNFLSSQQQQQLQQSQNQKRVRTRISDEQLKILRGYFDINNSPSEEQIQQMSEQSGLPPKVIKHWFRNTLFKERQRNKDSPYNFNNPPSTSIDLEEYEKTGKIPEIKTEPKDDYDDDDDDLPVDDRISDPDQDKMDRFENLYKIETPKSEYLEDKREPETYSNASTPSTTSSIPSTPTASVPNTPTPTTTPTSEDHCFLRNDSGSGKRANRTRFTDFQIKVLQEYFEQNAYPKDDELDHLSKLLNLSPRVIVVWFQNARQKARKIYENQPAADAKDGNTPFQRTPGLNYQCKKCNAVFQRYYELIKHQKRPCVAENNNNSLSNIDDDSNSTTMSQDDLSQTGSITEAKEQQPQQKNDDVAPQTATFQCDKCDASFNRLDLWQEHIKIHSMNPSLFPSFPTNSAFGMLQTLAHQEDNKAAAAAAAAAKRKLSAPDTDEERDDQPRDKRLRTTILPEQLDYLYQKYQLDCNPSRKQLESIAAEVGLKKRVVQVWFQNTRARERKGQYRAHQQLIHKRCPFCRALFRAKSALESHLATKHAEEMAKVEINVDAIPDASMESSPTSPQPMSTPTSGIPPPGNDLNKLLSLSPAGMQQLLPFMAPSGLGMSFPPADPLQLSMNKIYEDSFKKYINELSGGSHTPHSRKSGESTSKKPETESRVPAQNNEDDAPLDLSKPIKVNTETDKASEGPLTDLSERSDDHYLSRRISMDDSVSETYSDFDNSVNDDNTSNVNSPPSPSHYMSHPNKRYRTQMTSLQVRVMKSLFTDYKTPTMAECELLGREIGLPKRVVQVWFQNARAKEKKSKLALAKTYGSDVDFNKPPEDCSLCSFKYSHKFTIQDHIFTRKHIDNVKAFIQSQSDAEREMSDPTGMSTLLRQQREIDRVRKVWDDASTSTPHLAQLQAMGMNALGLPAGAGGSSTPLGLSPGHHKSESSSRHKSSNSSSGHGESSDRDNKESKSTPSRSSSSSKSQQHQQQQQQQQQQQEATASAEMAMNAQMMSALGGFLPGMDPSFLPYMYPGLPGYFPGMGMPLLQPGLIPGAEHMMAYDPLSFGTPLPLLQIPQEAIKTVGDKLSDPKSGLAQYTQDCKTVSDLKSQLSSVDYSCAQESSVDVGYICKKCQMVYPAKEACISHQRAMCFAGAKVSDNMKPMLKLEQKQYECRACAERFSTVYEFKLHCQMEVHKVKANKLYQRKSEGGSSSSSSASGSTPSKNRNVPSENRHESSSEDFEPKPKKPKIE